MEGLKAKFYRETWGCDDEVPCDFNEDGSSMLDTCLNIEGWGYDEAVECAREWQRQEENDHWK